MDNVPEQKYHPNQWLRYKFGRGQGISQVKSASYIPDKGWMYIVANPSDPTSTLFVNEYDVIVTVKPHED
jgi:hypothetical protein